MQVTGVRSLGQDPLGKEMATHSSIPAWKIPRTEECGGLRFTGLKRVRLGVHSSIETTRKMRLMLILFRIF